MGVDESNPQDHFLGTGDLYSLNATTGDRTLNAGSATVSGATENNGGNREHNNMQPYQVLRWLVALVGLYPSRN